MQARFASASVLNIPGSLILVAAHRIQQDTLNGFSFGGILACVAGARRGGGIGEIRRALERKGSAHEEAGGGRYYARFSRFARIPLPFPLLVPATQASRIYVHMAFWPQIFVFMIKIYLFLV